MALVTAAELNEADRALNLVAKVRSYVTHAEAILSDAESAGKPAMALAALDRALSCISTLAKLTGDLDERTTVNVLTTTPEFLMMQSAVIAALAPYPEALAAVKRALQTTVAVAS